MATYDNDLRLKEIATGDESGTWGTSTNTNLDLIADAFGYGTKEMAADANETFTMPDFSADATRGLYLKITSAVDLTATRVVTLGPNTVSKVWIIENATTGSQIITISQGSGANVNVANGSKVMVVTDGAGSGAAVFNANPTETGGTVTSVGGTGTVNGLTLTGTVTSSGNLTLGGTFSATVSEISDLTATAAEINVLDGITATTTELNYTDGVTSNIQTQLNAKAAYPIQKGIDYTAVSGDVIVVTAGSVTITLPATPSAGDTVGIKDGTGAAATSSFTVARNGENIASSATDLTFDVNFGEITMSYIDGTIGWSV
jgi:hypothetical protein